VSYNASNGRTSLTASRDVLAYKQKSPGRLTWFDRDGKPLGSIGEVGRDSNPSLAPDGSGRVGIDRWDPVTATYHVWVLDDHQGAIQLTHGRRERFARWSSDGMWVGYLFRNAGTTQIRCTRSNGGGSEETLRGGPKIIPLEFSRDFLLYQAGTSDDLFAQPLGGGDTIQITNTPSIKETTASFSPDGRWLAYTSDEGGQDNIWVHEFPSGASKHAVTSKGGMEPHWRSNGLELFYVAPDRSLTAVPVSGPGMTFGRQGMRRGPCPRIGFMLSTLWGARCPSLGDYVTGMRATRGATAAGGR
jgi:eukaryotic-like serine/threonine-protein kinase